MTDEQIEVPALMRGFVIDTESGVILATVRCTTDTWEVWAHPPGSILVACDDESIREETHRFIDGAFTPIE